MLIKTDINEKYKELELHVCSDRLDTRVQKVVGELHTMYDLSLSATDAAGNRRLLSPGEMFTFYAEKQKIYGRSADGLYAFQSTLQELENSLSPYGFIRISKSELVNMRKIKCLDLGMTGTIKVIMKNGYETFASRRNVAKLKGALK